MSSQTCPHTGRAVPSTSQRGRGCSRPFHSAGSLRPKRLPRPYCFWRRATAASSMVKSYWWTAASSQFEKVKLGVGSIALQGRLQSTAVFRVALKVALANSANGLVATAQISVKQLPTTNANSQWAVCPLTSSQVSVASGCWTGKSPLRRRADGHPTPLPRTQ
jgi:hypothetical protein